MISYEPFFKTMQKQGISTYALFKLGFSSTTYYRMKEGKNIKTDTIATLCKLLNCGILDIIEYVEK